MILLMWGPFPFRTGAEAYEELEHEWGGRWKDHEIIGRRPVGQYVGPDKETIRIKGVHFPLHQTGGGIVTGMMAAAGAGQVHPLVSGAGFLFGTFRLEKAKRADSFILPGGAAQKISYDLQFCYQEDTGGTIWSFWP